jgi:hypothetical protein
MSTTEPKLRWSAAPAICLKENLPCFPDAAAAEQYREKHCPHYHTAKTWKCDYCSQIHATWEQGGDDARVGGAPNNFKPFMQPAKSSRSTLEPELPRDEKRTAAIKLPRAKKSKGEQKTLL